MKNIPTFDLLGVHVSALNPEKAVEAIGEMMASSCKGYVCVAPVSTIVDCQRDESYRHLVNKAALVTPDGMPVACLGRWQGHKDVKRTYGPNLMLDVIEYGQALGYRHFFYGGTDSVCAKLLTRLKKAYPKMIVAGWIAPPYLAQVQEVKADVAREINQAKPDIIWVALGAPKQDFWMSLNQSVLEATVMVGVGAAFDFISGVKSQAPRWMQRVGLEWLFRLCSEPKRLWKRYLMGNAIFVGLVVKQMVKGLFIKNDN